MPLSETPSLPSPRELLVGALADRRRILAVSAGVLGLAVVAAMLLPTRYQANASLVVLLGQEYTVRAEAGAPAAASGTLESDQIMKAEVEILSGNGLHEQVIRRVGLRRLYPRAARPPGLLVAALRWVLGGDVLDPAKQAVERFDDALDVEASKDANVITVSFSNRDPVVAAETVNTLILLYQAQRRRIYVDPQASMVEGEVARLNVALGQADAALGAFRRSHDIANFDLQRDLLLQRRAALAASLQDDGASAAALRRQLATVAGELARTPATVAQYSEHDPDTRASTLLAALQDLRGREAQLATRLVPGSRILADLRREIAARQDELAQLQGDRTASVTRAGRNANHDAVELDRDHASADLASAEARVAATTQQLAATDEAVRRLSADDIEAEALARSRSVAEDNYRAMVRVLDDRRVTEAVDEHRAANVRLIAAAQAPVRPSKLPLLVVMGGTLLAAVAGAATALLGETLRRRIITAERLQRALGLPVLVSVPDWSMAR